MGNTKKLFFLFLCVVLGLAALSHFQKKPASDLDWADEFEILPRTEVSGKKVKLSNIRDWRYSESAPLSRNYFAEEYAVTEIERMWFVVEPFGAWDAVAHTYFVFDFPEKDPVAFSVEARREKGEEYDGISGMLRRYELAFLWGSEADFTSKRVINQKNEVYMYELQVPDEFVQALFLELATATEELYHTPRFYNTVTSNCTNTLADFANSVQPKAVPFSVARYLTGFSAQLLYDQGYLDTSLPFTELREQSRVTEIVAETPVDASFSATLRERLAAKK